MKKAVFMVIVGCFIVSGCAATKEVFRKIAGTSTREIETNRAFAIEETFKCKYDDCRRKAEESLLAMGAYIYAKRGPDGLIAVYVSEQDTTPVGVFFEAVSEDETRIQVSSPSTYAKELIAEKLFSRLKESSD